MDSAQIRYLSVIVGFCAACGGDDEPAASPDAGGNDASVVDAGAGDASSEDDAASAPDAAAISGNVGNFNVRLVQPSGASEGYVTATGKVYDGNVPPDLLWTESQSAGDCVLLKPSAPFCEGGCAAGEKCVDEDVCQRYPEAIDVGTVTLTGVTTKAGGESSELTPILGSYGPSGGVSYAYPGLTEGGAVKIDAAGKSVSGFSVAAQGVAPLVLTGTNYELDAAQPFVLAWTAPASGNARIRVRLDISHHGGARGLVTCDTADDGSLEIAASLVKGLIDLGVAGYPTVVVSRESIGESDIGAGSVSLTVYSDVEHAVQIEGLVSCGTDEPCPSGQTCQTDLTCK